MEFCPHCGKDLRPYLAVSGSLPPVPASYNQTATWKKIVEQAAAVKFSPPQPVALGERAADQLVALCQKGREARTVIHLAFDRSVVPTGGVLHQAVMLDGRTPMDLARLKALGYSVVDGKVQLVDDVPVGAAYSAISYWGGEKQHKRWHLAKEVELDASRNGDPCFMDDNMVAFVAVWADASKAGEAMHTLLELFLQGVNQGGLIANPLVLEVLAHP